LLRFSLSSDDALHREHKRRSLFDNPGFFDCLLELATDPNSKREHNALLKWWDKQVMPDVAKRKKAMRSSMAAKFKEEAARRAEARRAARRSERND